ncbi:MAG: hypothetical protein ACOZJX_06045 [Pseudomonadota bacterium]
MTTTLRSTPRRSPPRPLRRVVSLALVAALGAGLLLSAFWPGRGAATAPLAPARLATAHAAPVVVATPSTTPDEAPVIEPGQWAQLQAALAGDPKRDAEIARILDLLDYQRAVRRFATLRQAGADPTAQLALARRIDAGLPLRLARGEMSGPEAMRLKAALLEVLEPDAVQRAAALTAWRDHQLRENPPAADPRDAQLQQAQAALVARWRTQASPGTPPDGLVLELDALRQRIYDNKP